MAAAETALEKWRALLEAKTPDLLLHLKLSPTFWTVLVKHEAIQKHEADNIQVGLTSSPLILGIRQGWGGGGWKALIRRLTSRPVDAVFKV